jgi:hypothetical protein
MGTPRTRCTRSQTYYRKASSPNSLKSFLHAAHSLPTRFPRSIMHGDVLSMLWYFYTCHGMAWSGSREAIDGHHPHKRDEDAAAASASAALRSSTLGNLQGGQEATAICSREHKAPQSAGLMLLVTQVCLWKSLQADKVKLSVRMP